MNIFGRTFSTIDLIVAVAAFGLVLGLWFACFFLWNMRRTKRQQKIHGRLGLTDEERERGGTRVLRLWHEGREVTTAVPGSARKLTLGQRLGRLALEAELEGRLHSIFFAVLSAAALGFMILFIITQTILPGIALVAALAVGVKLYIGWRIARRASRFERQLVDALDLAARSLRAGHPLLGAFRLIADEISPPVSLVFDGICQRQSLGMSLEDSLLQASREHPSPDLSLFVASVIIQMRSGGNLADMMERIAFVIRDRMRLARKVRTLTAQTQLSKRILIALPIVMFILLNVLNPKYMASFYGTIEGKICLGIAGLGIILGAWVMNRMAILKY
jgi:tight adherence protein B